MGRPTGGAFSPPPPSPASATNSASREEEIASLKDMAGELRKQLAEVMERIDQLEKEE
jgi:hypothetical protein